MFCRKCGNELGEGQQFCPNCGTKMGECGNPTSSNAAPVAFAGSTSDVKQNFLAGTAALGKNKMWYFATVALVILSWIFAALPTFSVEALGLSKEGSLLTEDGTVQLIFTAIYIVAVVLLLLPLLTGKECNKRCFLATKIAMILSLLWFALALAAMNEQASQSTLLGANLVEVSLTAGGWFYLITTVGALVLSFKVPMDIARAEQAARFGAPMN